MSDRQTFVHTLTLPHFNYYVEWDVALPGGENDQNELGIVDRPQASLEYRMLKAVWLIGNTYGTLVHQCLQQQRIWLVGEVQ